MKYHNQFKIAVIFLILFALCSFVNAYETLYYQNFDNETLGTDVPNFYFAETETFKIDNSYPKYTSDYSGLLTSNSGWWGYTQNFIPYEPVIEIGTSEDIYNVYIDFNLHNFSGQDNIGVFGLGRLTEGYQARWIQFSTYEGILCLWTSELGCEYTTPYYPITLDNWYRLHETIYMYNNTFDFTITDLSTNIETTYTGLNIPITNDASLSMYGFYFQQAYCCFPSYASFDNLEFINGTKPYQDENLILLSSTKVCSLYECNLTFTFNNPVNMELTFDNNIYDGQSNSNIQTFSISPLNENTIYNYSYLADGNYLNDISDSSQIKTLSFQDLDISIKTETNNLILMFIILFILFVIYILSEVFQLIPLGILSSVGFIVYGISLYSIVDLWLFITLVFVGLFLLVRFIIGYFS